VVAERNGAFLCRHPGYWAFNIMGFVIALISLLGKLEKVPFDIPKRKLRLLPEHLLNIAEDF